MNRSNREIVVLLVTPTSVVEEIGIPEKGDRHMYSAAGIEIYVRLQTGVSLAKNRHKIDHMACVVCQDRHIPQISLRCIVEPRKRQKSKRKREVESRMDTLL